MTLTLFCFISEFGSFAGLLHHRPILSAEYRISLLARTDPLCSAVSAIAELLADTYHMNSCTSFGACIKDEIRINLPLALSLGSFAGLLHHSG